MAYEPIADLELNVKGATPSAKPENACQQAKEYVDRTRKWWDDLGFWRQVSQPVLTMITHFQFA